jgi:enamine deaminase RidA (YjgF/YER057c/UK114 family)
MMTTDQRLIELGIELPHPPQGVGAYVPWIRTGNLIITSGQLPWKNGEIAYAGKCGKEFQIVEGYQAARLCAVNALAQLKQAVGHDWTQLVRIVRVEGYVHTAPGFRGHPDVLNGASELFNRVFGDAGIHVRVALGIAEMPLNAAVQIVVWAEVKS